jgi:hypothetical protein
MLKRRPATPRLLEGGIPQPQAARYNQAEIDNRAWGLYAERYKSQPKELHSLCREASRFYAQCLQQAHAEMGPALDYGDAAGTITPATVAPEVQALIDRMALRRASPLERMRNGFLGR